MKPISMAARFPVGSQAEPEKAIRKNDKNILLFDTAVEQTYFMHVHVTLLSHVKKLCVQISKSAKLQQGTFDIVSANTRSFSHGMFNKKT